MRIYIIIINDRGLLSEVCICWLYPFCCEFIRDTATDWQKKATTYVRRKKGNVEELETLPSGAAKPSQQRTS